MKTVPQRSTIALLLSTALALTAAACRSTSDPSEPRVQGWTAAERSAWYQGTQGSRLMPAAWARALERADSQELFFTNASLTRFRFLPLPDSVAGLPVGFALDDRDARNLSFTNLTFYQGQPNNERWVGLNCSACHTARMSWQGQEMTIDGGPSLVDFQGFIEGVDAAMDETDRDAAKWDRFAARVLQGHDNPANRTMLQTAFRSLLAWNRDNARLNATPLRYGYGRLDAFGHIFNKVAQLAVNGTTVRATPNAADAPVSYPFLWNIYRQNRLQWNGIVATNRISLGGDRYFDAGALARNTGEVIGVFGDVVIEPNHAPHGFNSSVQAKNLDRLETVLRRLEPPPWPASFPAPVASQVAEGQALFTTMCQGCHQAPPAGTSVYQVHMMPLSRDSQGHPNRNNTDPWMACNALSYTSNTGKLEGSRDRYVSGTALPANAPLATMLSTTVIATIIGDWREILSSTAQTFFGIERLPRVVGANDQTDSAARRAARLDACYQANDRPRAADAPAPFAYKARALDGIWATAPYLHNGSVPTLYDLLRAPADRPTRFFVGTREYDPAHVGYRTEANAPGNGFEFVATGNGNSNEGHDYNVGRLTEAQRLALLEYLKTL